MAHNNGYLLALCEILLQIVGEALCGHAHGVYVHAVAAGTHDAAQTACSKLQVFVETLNEVGLVGLVEHCLHVGTC